MTDLVGNRQHDADRGKESDKTLTEEGQAARYQLGESDKTDRISRWQKINRIDCDLKPDWDQERQADNDSRDLKIITGKWRQTLGQGEKRG